MVKTSAIVCCALGFAFVQESSAYKVKVVQRLEYKTKVCDDADLDTVFFEPPCDVKLATFTSSTMTCDATHAISTSYSTAPNNECPTGEPKLNEKKEELNKCIASPTSFYKLKCVEVDDDRIMTLTTYGADCSEAPKDKKWGVFDPVCRHAALSSVKDSTQLMVTFFSKDDCSGQPAGSIKYTCGDVCHVPVSAGTDEGGTDHVKLSMACNAKDTSPSTRQSSFSTRISNSIPLLAILVSLVTGLPKLICQV